MSAESSSRRERRWQARYAKSQQHIERIAVASDGNNAVPSAPALSTVTAPNGSVFTLRLIPPGEPVQHELLFALSRGLIGFGPRGLSTRRTAKTSWIVLLLRQKGPWRGFETLSSTSFATATAASTHLLAVRAQIEAGAHSPFVRSHRGP